MTRDDIIRMAHASRLTDPDLGDWMTDYGDAEDAIIKFAALVAAAEREACAKVCDEVDEAGYAANRIRARGQDPMPLFDDWNKDWR